MFARSRVVFLALLMVLLAPHAVSHAADGRVAPALPRTSLEVQVTDSAGNPLLEANIAVPELELEAATDAQGRFSLELDAPEAPLALTIQILAPGYRDWTLNGALLLPNDTLQIDAPLNPGRTPEVIDVQAPRTDDDLPTPNTNTHPQLDAVEAYSFPAYIKVKRVNLNRIDTVAFKDYVKHVLPNEWISSWNTNSLRAGAVAAKEFAWYNTSIKRKYYWTTAYDVLDTTADQVYNPNVSYASTNSAVDATWSTIVLKSGKPFQTQFCAGAANSSRTSGQCGELYGSGSFPAGYFMSQNGSQYLASRLGYSWQSILTFYYTNSTLGTVGGGGGSPTIPAWPTLRSGSSGVKVTALQHLLRYRGVSISVDGSFGPATESAVRSFQSANGLAADGTVGPQTFSKLVATVRQGDNNNAVRAIQTLLGITADGSFGSGTASSVRSLQSAYGLAIDGVVGPQTWQTAFGK